MFVVCKLSKTSSVSVVFIFNDCVNAFNPSFPIELPSNNERVNLNEQQQWLVLFTLTVLLRSMLVSVELTFNDSLIDVAPSSPI